MGRRYLRTRRPQSPAAGDPRNRERRAILAPTELPADQTYVLYFLKIVQRQSRPVAAMMRNPALPPVHVTKRAGLLRCDIVYIVG